MKINEFIKDVRKLDKKFSSSSGRLLSDTLIDDMDIWSNQACKGYLLKAVKYVGLAPDLVIELRNALDFAFSEMSVEDAEEYYENN